MHSAGVDISSSMHGRPKFWPTQAEPTMPPSGPCWSTGRQRATAAIRAAMMVEVRILDAVGILVRRRYRIWEDYYELKGCRLSVDGSVKFLLIGRLKLLIYPSEASLNDGQVKVRDGR